uniref:Ig-like domain-containing protein n=1 Tax=Sinocyclocheilus anshuiensis TaxID=1608454 RepID=A0A671R0B6_9TELE
IIILKTLIQPKAKVSIKPAQHVFREETVTLRCDIDGEGVTGWRYSWYKDGSNSVFSDQQEHTFRSVTESDAGKYFCYGAERGGSRTSNIERPKAKVSIKPAQHVFREETVTLRCDIDGEGVTGWRYSWYKDGSNSVFSDQQEHTFRSVTESDAGKYFCYGAERGGSRTSNIGDEVTLTVVPSAVLSVSPQKWLTEGDPVTLICEVYGSSTGWTFSWYTLTASSGKYFCYGAERGGSRTSNISDAVTLTKSKLAVPKYSIYPVHPVTEGDTLTLRCLDQNTTSLNLRADFYKDGSLIQNQTTEMIISTVSKSHEGFYYCKHPERGESPKTSSASRSEEFNLMIVGVTAGLTVTFLIIVVLVLLWRYRNNKGPSSAILKFNDIFVDTNSVPKSCELPSYISLSWLSGLPTWRLKVSVRSQSHSSVSQQQNSSQTSEQNQSDAGNNTLLSGQSLPVNHK